MNYGDRVLELDPADTSGSVYSFTDRAVPAKSP
jgi:hypothetical protein